MIRDDPEAEAMLEEAVQGKHGGDRKSQEVQIKSDIIRLDSDPVSHAGGTSRLNALRRLRRQRPDLHARASRWQAVVT